MFIGVCTCEDKDIRLDYRTGAEHESDQRKRLQARTHVPEWLLARCLECGVEPGRFPDYTSNRSVAVLLGCVKIQPGTYWQGLLTQMSQEAFLQRKAMYNPQDCFTLICNDPIKLERPQLIYTRRGGGTTATHVAAVYRSTCAFKAATTSWADSRVLEPTAGDNGTLRAVLQKRGRIQNTCSS